MNILGRFQLSRDRSVTVANLVDELLERNGDCEVSIEDGIPRRLVQNCNRKSAPSMRFCAATSGCVQASRSPSIAATILPASAGFWPSSAPGASRFH
jgi:hypothetical protein